MSLTSQFSLQPADTPERIDLPGAELLYFSDAGLRDTSALLQRLIAEVPWREEHITVYGKTHMQPRLIAWFGDSGARYTYSGLSHSPQAWNAELARLRKQIEYLCRCDFNSVLLNYYRDGKDSMGLHADDEPELGPEPVIASLSLGATRRMYFKHKTAGELPTRSIDLPDGSLLVMRGATQENWKHGIRKTARCHAPRINLTFRQVTPAGR